MAESEEMGNKATKDTKNFDNTKLLKQVIDAIEHGFSDKVSFKGSYWF